jgi:hypothetical protein
MKCRKCGCTDESISIDSHWVEDDLCSECVFWEELECQEKLKQQHPG